ncbi:astacin protease 28, putative [Brugia malayi]|uniref:Astacin protease 28, putative n=2 Tax=Brugia malayi TaxID=6279 RepID=A0A4E9EQD1_BRUMA|nr:astacin protease 28, putative [Brugia malayi]VIO85938.1 astacin protease 28, putative [Brugia malayi]
MMQPQINFIIDQDESENTKPAGYKFWCCQCTRNEINDVARINNNSSLSNGIVVTQQPLPSNQSNCGHNNLSFSNYASEIKNAFSEEKHELDDDSEMKFKMKRLKEESINITSVVLDNLISEAKKIDPTEEQTKTEQAQTKKFSTQQNLTENVCNMDDIVFSDIDGEDQWKSMPESEQITRIGSDHHKEQVIHDNCDNEEIRKISNISDAFSISEQTSKIELFEENSSQIKNAKIQLNEVDFLNNINEADNSGEDVDNFSNSIKNLTSFTNRKLSANTSKSNYLSMICIPDDDLILKKENSQNISMEIGLKNTSISEHDAETVIRSNKMYANDMSSSSSSDNDEMPEIIMSNKNTAKVLNLPVESRKIDTVTMRHTSYTSDENVSENNDNVKMFADD